MQEPRDENKDKNDSVLIIEDDEDLSTTLEFVLSAEGFRVETASNGWEALVRIERELPGVILLDMKMPVMDGWEFSKRFRERYDHQAPIIVNTAAEDAGRRAREVGAEGFIGKPFDIDELIRLVHKHMKKPIAA